jgi:hypothetical protein
MLGQYISTSGRLPFHDILFPKWNDPYQNLILSKLMFLNSNRNFSALSRIRYFGLTYTLTTRNLVLGVTDLVYFNISSKNYSHYFFFNVISCSDLSDYKSTCLCAFEILSCSTMFLLTITGCCVSCQTCYRSLTIETCSFCHVCVLSVLSLLPGMWNQTFYLAQSLFCTAWAILQKLFA